MSALLNHPHIEMTPRTALRPDPNSPRKHPKKQLEQLARVIAKVGFLVPIIADETGLIVAGHGRWLAAVKLELEDVPVIRASFVTEADRRAFAVADNRMSELSGWDEDLLKAELEFLFEQDYDITFTGFDLDHLDLGVVGEGSREAPVELADPSAEAVSRAGDLWLIGPHRLYCGNSRDSVSYEALLAGERASAARRPISTSSSADYRVSTATATAYLAKPSADRLAKLIAGPDLS